MNKQIVIHTVYILAKNEETNIARCIESIVNSGLTACVLDSGSTDQTIPIAQSYQDVVVEHFDYQSHCQAYNEIFRRHSDDQFVMVVDADIRFSPELVDEIHGVLRSDSQLDSLIAPVDMFWEGRPLRHCSLYPPKPIVFRGGADRFVRMGHGESLTDDTRRMVMKNTIIHDDRKPVATFLLNQSRYANNLVERARHGGLNWKDRIRVKWPLFVFVTPFFTYFFKFGFLDGKAGLVYAIDRLIFETLGYRAVLKERIDREIADEAGPNTK